MLRGRAYPLPPQPGDHLLALRAALQQVLYEVCYTRLLSDSTFDQWRPSTTSDADNGFTEVLAQAVGGAPRWEGGWRAASSPGPEGIWLTKRETCRWAQTGHYLPSSEAGLDGYIWLLIHREWRHPLPGFYFINGRTPGDEWDEAHPARFYLHTRASTAVAVSEIVVKLLDTYEVPFRFKTLNVASMYDRADASVLYVGTQHAAVVERLLRYAFANGSSRWLDESVPLFTMCIIPGVGFAVDPGTGESFGTDRCRILAEGILDAWQTGDTSVDGRWSAVEARFAAVGVDLDHAYLGVDQASWFEC